MSINLNKIKKRRYENRNIPPNDLLYQFNPSMHACMHAHAQKIRSPKIMTWCVPHCSHVEHGTYVTVLPVSTIRENICGGVPIQSLVVKYLHTKKTSWSNKDQKHTSKSNPLYQRSHPLRRRSSWSLMWALGWRRTSDLWRWRREPKEERVE